MNTLITGIIGPLILIALILGAVNKLTQYSCFAAWEDSGMPVKYSFMGGCKIQLPDGKWIPEDRYREISDK
jgi:hypothetical protein